MWIKKYKECDLTKVFYINVAGELVLEREMNDDAMMHVKYPTNFPANHATRIQLQKSSASFATLLHIFSQLSGK